LKRFSIAKLLLFVHGVLHGLLIISLTGWGELVIGSPYYFKYCLPARVFDVEGAPMSAAKADSTSPELMRKEIPSSISLVEMLITLLEDV